MGGYAVFFLFRRSHFANPVRAGCVRVCMLKDTAIPPLANLLGPSVALPCE